MDNLTEKARELGRLLGQTEEYRALQRARERLSDDREAVKAMNRLADLEVQIGRALQQGKEPAADAQQEYERTFSELQASPIYQGYVAAQSNFDKVLARTNDEIGKGMEAGSQSRIILPS